MDRQCAGYETPTENSCNIAQMRDINWIQKFNRTNVNYGISTALGKVSIWKKTEWLFENRQNA